MVLTRKSDLLESKTILLALFAESAETSVTLTPGNFYTVQLFDPNWNPLVKLGPLTLVRTNFF